MLDFRQIFRGGKAPGHVPPNDKLSPPLIYGINVWQFYSADSATMRSTGEMMHFVASPPRSVNVAQLSRGPNTNAILGSGSGTPPMSTGKV